MIAFALSGALLAALALAVLMRPLVRRKARGGDVSRDALNLSVYREQLRELDADVASGALAREDHARARGELERRMLDDVGEPSAAAPAAGASRGLIGGLAVAVPVLAVVIYLAVGSPDAMVPQQADAHAVDAMVGRLAARLKENPDDARGWQLLARSYQVLERFQESAAAYAKAAALAPRDAQLLADFADALAMARGRSLQGEPERLALRALEIDPENLKALALAGTAAFERKDFAGAARHWERMLPLVQPGSEDAQAIRANIAEARSLSGGKVSIAGKGVQGVVRLSASLSAKVSPDDTVFIFARAAGGPPMPLAVLRKKARELPVAFALDDSMAMAPGMKLSEHPRIVVGARVSRSGSATPQPGDLQGLSGVVANTAQGVALVIDAELAK